MVFFNRLMLGGIVQTSFQIYRTKFAISMNNVLDSCLTTRDYETCYLDISYQQNHPVALVVSPPEDEDEEAWLDTYTVDFKCQDRVLLYIAMAVAFTVFSLLAACLAAKVCQCICYDNARSRYNSENMSDTAQASLKHTSSSYGAI